MATVQKSNNRYEKIMMDAIEECLSSLGEETRFFVYNYISKSHCIEKNQIPSNLEAFVKALESVLGDGAKFLEFLIMKRFNKKIGNMGEFEDWEIGDYMMAATVFSKKIIEFVEIEKKKQCLSIDEN